MDAYPVKILAALNQVMSKVGYVQKQGKNAFHNYKYAGEGHLLEVLRPAMVEAGLLLIPSHRAYTAPDDFGNTTVTVDYTLAHKDGDVWPEKITVVGCGNDKNSKGGVGDKGIYKALTGANKYLLFKLFQIETGDDPEQASDHDKNGEPLPTRTTGERLPDPTQGKNPPGISAVKVEVREVMREIHACSDWEQLLALLNERKPLFIKVATIFTNEWTGPDGTGLRGEALKVATQLGNPKAMEAWLSKCEQAKALTQQAAE